MDMRAWEMRLGVRLDDLEAAPPPELLELHEKLTALESQLDESVRPICEQLVDLLNLKASREMSELILDVGPIPPVADT